MRRFFLVPLFALGAVIGFGSEFHHHGACRWQDRQAEYERHVADVCVNAALNAQQQRAATTPTVVPTAVAAPTPQPAPSNVPVVIVNTVPGQAAAPAQPVFYGYPPGYAVQYAPAPVASAPGPAPAPAPTPATR